MANYKIEHFWRSLETMIECPICNKRLTGPVYMCGSGHSICAVCTNGGTVCIRCRAPYTKIQNLLVENFLSKYDYLKTYLKDLNDTKKNPTTLVNAEKKKSDESVDVNDGKYRCWITDQCQFSADVPSIVQHFKNVHAHHFDEHLAGKLPFKKTWEMNYAVGKNFDRAIKIGGLVFIVHISVNGIGELGACVLMYTSNGIADSHICQIEIECVNKNLCYKNAKVISAKSPVRTVLGFRHSGLQIERNKLMYNALRQNQLFKCTVLLQRKIKTTENKGKSTKQTSENTHKNQISTKDVDEIEVINDAKEIVKADTVGKSPDLNVSEESNGALSMIGDGLEDGRDGEVPECILS